LARRSGCASAKGLDVPLISIVSPMFNEEAVVRPFLERVAQAMGEIPASSTRSFA
jgi:hypothetical protein